MVASIGTAGDCAGRPGVLQAGIRQRSKPRSEVTEPRTWFPWSRGAGTAPKLLDIHGLILAGRDALEPPPACFALAGSLLSMAHSIFIPRPGHSKDPQAYRNRLWKACKWARALSFHAAAFLFRHSCPAKIYPRGLCDGVLRILRHHTSGPSPLGAAGSALGVLLVEIWAGFTSTFGWSIHPRGLRWIQALMTTQGGNGEIVREACFGEAGKHIPEWAILGDAHTSCRGQGNPSRRELSNLSNASLTGCKVQGSMRPRPFGRPR
ncbi:hypothetical protein K456DRAFT_1940783 [Colletotrichum gloeosporioides 23]|nr:hypothetical protein K456DRAFT_1940783 [Colletotrichum gloeosporioides 23]